jgi:hypothetical protein
MTPAERFAALPVGRGGKGGRLARRRRADCDGLVLTEREREVYLAARTLANFGEVVFDADIAAECGLKRSNVASVRAGLVGAGDWRWQVPSRVEAARKAHVMARSKEPPTVAELCRRYLEEFRRVKATPMPAAGSALTPAITRYRALPYGRGVFGRAGVVELRRS